VTSFERRIVELEPDAVLDHEAAVWQDAIVVVTAGEIELECWTGERRRFRRGEILTLARLPLRRVRSSGKTPARLLAIWRRAAVAGKTG
jgi:quercetin dioxygenase-like cupin family protein